MSKFYNMKAELYKIILNYRNIVELLNRKIEGFEENASELVFRGKQFKKRIQKYERKRLLSLNEIEIEQLYQELSQTEKDLVLFRNEVLSLWIKQNVKRQDDYRLKMTR